MASGKDKVDKVRSARKWLMKAEASFDDNADVRGELNLMLAEAEMKHLRKHHGTGKKVRTLLAFGVALVLAVSAWQIHGWLLRGNVAETATIEEHQEQAVAVPTPVSAPIEKAEPRQNEPAKEDRREVESPAPTTTHVTLQPVDTATVPVQNEQALTVTHTSPARETVLTNRQVQDAVQDARHTLRGTGTK